MRYFFARLAEKYKLSGNLEKILKIFDKNSTEKLNFYLFLEKFWLKIEPSEITSFFYNNFFQFLRGTFPVFPPGGAYGFGWLILTNYWINFGRKALKLGVNFQNFAIKLQKLKNRENFRKMLFFYKNFYFQRQFGINKY